jgi:hypothetical protein
MRLAARDYWCVIGYSVSSGVGFVYKVANNDDGIEFASR